MRPNVEKYPAEALHSILAKTNPDQIAIHEPVYAKSLEMTQLRGGVFV
jgi:hypothetical protein